VTAERVVQDALAARLEDVRGRIIAAARRAQRDPSSVTLVAVSKTFGADMLLEAIAAGITDLGENRAQELKEKVAVIGDRAHGMPPARAELGVLSAEGGIGIRWHFVGHLQTNKVRHVVGSVVLVHSIDRLGIAEAVARRARSLGITQDALIEVNLASEPSKHGAAPEEAVALAEEVDAIDGIRVRGLMAMPPAAPDPDAVRPYFRRLADLRARLLQRVGDAGELSMGMSGDFEAAIEEGATIVRVGEAIFGPRR
jgi:pyridoxal phosphate enzyme (YggS family)